MITLLRALLSLQIISGDGSFVLPQHWVNVFIGLILIVAVLGDIWVRQSNFLDRVCALLRAKTAGRTGDRPMPENIDHVHAHRGDAQHQQVVRRRHARCAT